MRFTRLSGRVRIETASTSSRSRPIADSPGSRAGCGLKQISPCWHARCSKDSPGSRAGCGLKPLRLPSMGHVDGDSPSSRAGCGLKRVCCDDDLRIRAIHPALGPGAD